MNLADTQPRPLDQWFHLRIFIALIVLSGVLPYQGRGMTL